MSEPSDTPDIEAIGYAALNVTLDTISSLSWAIPEAGPFVSAAIGIIQAIIGGLSGGQHDSVLQNMQTIGDSIVTRIKNLEEDAAYKSDLDAVQSFTAWIKILTILLDTSDPKTYLAEVRPLLSTLEDVFSPTLNKSLFSLKVKLLADPDLAAGKAYNTAHKYQLANAKLHLLFMVMAQYLIALKLKIVLISHLYEMGYDTNWQKIDPLSTSNPDNTFSLLDHEIEEFKKRLPAIIDQVRSRRAAMIVLEVAPTVAAITIERKPIANRGDWKLGSHDALYTGDFNDQMARDLDDHPSIAMFVSQTGGPLDPTPFPSRYTWQRTEIRDAAVYDGKHPQDWVLSTGHYLKNWFDHNTERAENLRQAYLTNALQHFDECSRIPKLLDESIVSLRDKWVPVIPRSIDDKLYISAWGATPADHEIWSNKTIEVRYLFTLKSSIGKESAPSDQMQSSDWVKPNGGNPKIIGLPVDAVYLKYVKSLCLYRQFRQALPDGKWHQFDPRKVAIISRCEGEGKLTGQAVFPGFIVDTADSDFDKKILQPTNTYSDARFLL